MIETGTQFFLERQELKILFGIGSCLKRILEP